MSEKIIVVPNQFSFQDRFLYPSDNFFDFEFWLSRNIKPEEFDSERIYLPITWTAYYKTCDYGNDLSRVGVLQDYLNSLDKKKKYFSVVQWDNGIINKIDHLDLKVFSMCGKPCHYPIPLLSQPHIVGTSIQKRDIFCSFVGRMTHGIRNEMLAYLPLSDGRYYTSTMNHPLPKFCDILARSVFVLAPRGYGVSSFRIGEAIQFGAIPVYVSDVFHEGHNIDFSTYGVKIEAKDVRRVDEILSSIAPDEIRVKQSKLKQVYDQLYSFEGNKKLILANL